MIRSQKLLLASAVMLALATASAAHAQQRRFDLPAQPAVNAIPEFARQAGVQIVAPARSLQGIDTPAINGDMDAREAMRRLLEGTDLEIQSDDGSIITLRRRLSSVTQQASGSGYVSGSVLDPATGGYLRNALVRITTATGTRTVFSGERGEFALNDVPPGEATVVVSYTGFGEVSRTVQVKPGGRERVDVELRSTLARNSAGADATLDTLQVVGVREGDARAIMEQRASMNITNSLSAESYGEIGDGNPAEFLKNMPGVDFDVVADDVPRNISLRGLAAKYTGVTINGVSLAGVDANNGAGSSRQFSFEQSALTGVDSITVYKTTGADMDANAPAGTIDIRTRKAFDGKGRRITAEVSAGTHSNMWDSANTGPSEGGYGGKKVLPSGKINYADVFLDGRLGVVAGISNNTSYVEHEQITANRNYTPTATSPEPYAVTAIAANMFNREYNRRAASLGVDFRATDDLILSLMASVSRGDIEAAQITPTFTTNARTRGVDGEPAAEFTTRSDASSKTVSLANPKFDYKIGYSRSFIPAFEWSTENFKLDGNLFASSSDSRYDSGRKGQVALLSSAPAATGNFSAGRSDLNSQDWDIQQVSGGDWSDPASFTISGKPTVRTTSGSTAESKLRGGALNFSFFQDIGGVPVTWKTGLKVARTDYAFGNVSDLNNYTYNGPLDNAEFLAAVQSRNEYSFGDSGMYINTLGGGGMYMPSLARIHQMMQAHPEHWAQNLSAANWYSAMVANSRQLEESISSLYFMGTADLTEKLRVQAGVRWERTEDISQDFDPLGADEVIAAGHAINPATGRASTIDGLQYQYFSRGRTERSGDYDDFFPSASIKYSFTGTFDLIAGYSRTVQRPEISDLAGVWSYSLTEDGTVLSAPNQNLQPEYSDNFSIRAVKYFEPVGLIALNYYRNKIKDLITTSTLTPEEFGYTGNEPVDLVSTSTNSSDEYNVHGYELEFNHAMDYLPGALAGLSVRGAYMRSFPDQVFERVSTRVAQFGLGWKYGRLRVNLNTVWANEKDRGQTGNIATPNGTITQSQPFLPYTEVNLSAGYTFIRKTRDNLAGLEVFFSANNIFNQNRGSWYSNAETGLADSGHHSQIYIHTGRKATLGIRARF